MAMNTRVEVEDDGIVTVHLDDGDIWFEDGQVVDGPAVCHDYRGPLMDCQICNTQVGYQEGPVGEVLARQAVMQHRCPPIRQAIAVLAAHHELERRKAEA